MRKVTNGLIVRAGHHQSPQTDLKDQAEKRRLAREVDLEVLFATLIGRDEGAPHENIEDGLLPTQSPDLSPGVHLTLSARDVLLKETDLPAAEVVRQVFREKAESIIARHDAQLSEVAGLQLLRKAKESDNKVAAEVTRRANSKPRGFPIWRRVALQSLRTTNLQPD